MTIAERVESILKYDQRSRDSDKRLMLVYMQKAGMELSQRQIELFYKLPSMETIRRTRQQLQMEGKYPASTKVEQERYEKFKQMRHGGFTNPEATLEQQPVKYTSKTKSGKMEIMPRDSEEYKTAMELWPD